MKVKVNEQIDRETLLAEMERRVVLLFAEIPSRNMYALLFFVITIFMHASNTGSHSPRIQYQRHAYLQAMHTN